MLAGRLRDHAGTLFGPATSWSHRRHAARPHGRRRRGVIYRRARRFDGIEVRPPRSSHSGEAVGWHHGQRRWACGSSGPSARIELHTPAARFQHVTLAPGREDPARYRARHRRRGREISTSENLADLLFPGSGRARAAFNAGDRVQIVTSPESSLQITSIRPAPLSPNTKARATEPTAASAASSDEPRSRHRAQRTRGRRPRATTQPASSAEPARRAERRRRPRVTNAAARAGSSATPRGRDPGDPERTPGAAGVRARGR